MTSFFNEFGKNKFHAIKFSSAHVADETPFLQSSPVFSAEEIWNHYCNITKCDEKKFLPVAVTSVTQNKHSADESRRTLTGMLVSSVEQITAAKNTKDFLYLPMEVCRQGDILQASVDSGLPVIAEKGIFLSPMDVERLVDKLQGAKEFAIVECGSAFGYSDRILDPRSLHHTSKLTKHFGVSLSDLFCQFNSSYPHRNTRLSNLEFLDAFIKTANAFGVSFFVVKT